MPVGPISGQRGGRQGRAKGSPGEPRNRKKTKIAENPVLRYLKNRRFHGFFNFSLRGDSRRPPTAIRQPPGIPPKNPSRNPSWARKCHIRPWRIVALIRVCVGNFPNSLFENGTVLALMKLSRIFWPGLKPKSRGPDFDVFAI